MAAKKAENEQVRRRLYSLYAEQITKLQELAAQAGISQSEYLRQLIDVAYVEKRQSETRYVSFDA